MVRYREWRGVRLPYPDSLTCPLGIETLPDPLSTWELMATPPPRTVVVLGSGPSLNQYRRDMYDEETCVVALNDVCEQTDCDYFVYLDKCCGALKPKSPEALPWRPPRWWYQHGARGYVMEGLTVGKTFAAAISILSGWGVGEIQAWGHDSWPDGGDGSVAYWRRFSPKPANDPATMVKLHRGNILRTKDILKRTGMKVRWMHLE